MRLFLLNTARLLLAFLLLLPTLALARSLPMLPGILRNSRTALILGTSFGGGLVFFSMVQRFAPAYVFGHELTHWLAAKLFRRRTGRFRLRGTRGSVDVERPNIWISLAPYFIPLYTLLWLGFCGLGGMVVDGGAAWVQALGYAGTGISYAFHVVLTVHCLRRQQADLRRHGRLLSLSLILFCNVFLLYLFALAFSGAWLRGWHLPLHFLLQQLESCADFIQWLWP